MFWTRRRSHLSDEDLSVLLDGQLERGRLQAVTVHLETCARCQAAFEELRGVMALVSRLPLAEPSRSFTLAAAVAAEAPSPTRVRRSGFAFAPVAALAVLVALFAVDLSSGGSTTSGPGGSATDALTAKSSDAAAGEAARPTVGAFAAESAASPSPTPGAPAASAPASGRSVESVQPSASATAGAPVAGRVPPPPTGEGAAQQGAAQEEREAAASEDVAAPLSGEDDGGLDWLRVGEVLAAIAFVVSLVFASGPAWLRSRIARRH